MRQIPFFRPDISEAEITEVADTLRSGWITTGQKTKLLEEGLRNLIFHDMDGCLVCLNSATAAEELNLRVLGIEPGDEVIVPAYTYTATAAAAIHCGATVRFIDIQKDGDPVAHAPEMDYEQLEAAITEKTKAIIPVDYGGLLCDYGKLRDIVSGKEDIFIVSDSAHALGAVRRYNGKWCSSAEMADFASFSFHAVKNFTTAEGGAAAWRNGVDKKTYQLLSNHGQDRGDSWEYDIIGPWYKYNMTDVAASIGLGQLKRYPEMLEKRREIVRRYDEMCERIGLFHLIHTGEDHRGNCHLYPIRIPGIDVEKRDDIIRRLAGMGVQTNVHFKPLPMMTAYKELSGGIGMFPNSYDYYRNLITLPLYSLLTDDEVSYICECVRNMF